MNKNHFKILLLIFCITLFISCYKESCDCFKDSGCRIITIKLLSNDSLITRRFCSQTRFYSDSAAIDSANAFLACYKSSSTVITNTDSVYMYDYINNVKPGETQNYNKNGYDCFFRGK